jgi:hypothetical protein
MAAGPVFGLLVPEGKRVMVAMAALAVVLLQLISMSGIYTSRFLPSELFADYDQACKFLKSAPLEGRVHPLSGRYFYLTLPGQAGRPLDTESSGRHFQLKWVRHLETAGNASAEAIRSYMNLAGVAYILLDKEDPFSPKQMQDFFRSVYPVAYENRYFAVLANPGTLYPAFLARDFVALPPESYPMAPAVLQLFPQNVITVEASTVDPSAPGYAGQAKGPNQVELLQKYQSQSGTPFVRVPLCGDRMEDYQRMTFRVPPEVSGWLVVTEAYHPDWTVTIDGKPGVTARAEAAMLATRIPEGSHDVVFRFRAPVWYTLCLAVGVLCWIAALFALFYMPSKWAPSGWRAWWLGQVNMEGPAQS